MDIERDLFQERHIGPSAEDQAAMLVTLGYDSLDAFIDAVVPADIRLREPLRIPKPGPSRKRSRRCACSPRRIRSSALISAWVTTTASRPP